MNKIKIALALVFAVLLTSGCKKEEGKVGLELQPDDELLNTSFFDTTTVMIYSAFHDDSVTTNGTTINMLGCVQDPIFGKVSAGIYTQFRPESFNANFGSVTNADSLVLTLVYNYPFGDTLQPFRVRVYELNEDLQYGAKYYASTTLNCSSEDLVVGGNGYNFAPTPKSITDTSISFAVMRIPLKPSFADSKFIAISGGSQYASHEAFQNYFKGLYIVADAMTANGCMISTALTNSNSEMSMYYTNADGNKEVYRFLINDSCLRVGTFAHDYTNADADLRAQLAGNYSSTTEKLFLQTGFGVKMVVNFPYLQQYFKDKKVIVHRAELVLSRIDDSDTNQYTLPSQLRMNYYDTTKSALAEIVDIGGFTLSYFGGTFNAETGEYRMRITQHIQELLDGRRTANDLNIFVSASANRMQRFSIYGTAPAAAMDKRLKLNLYYTLMDN